MEKVSARQDGLPAMVGTVADLQRQREQTRQELNALPKKERLLRLAEVEHRCGIRKSTIYALQKKGEFPACVQCGARAVAWPESRIDAWIAARLAAAPGGVQGAGNE